MFDEAILNKGNNKKHVQVVLRVLKECRLLSEFKEYLTTQEYKRFAFYYARSHQTTELWYDRCLYSSILGCCDFGYFLNKKGIINAPQLYELVMVYAAMFETSLYHKEPCVAYDSSVEKFISYEKENLNEESLKIVAKWENLKNIDVKKV